MKLLDTVKLLEDKPENNLSRGQVGTIVEVLAEDVFEVEFVGDDGRTQALVALPEAALAQDTEYETLEAKVSTPS